MLIRIKNVRVATCCAAIIFGLTAGSAVGQQVIVLGSPDDVIGWLQAENWWGEEKHGEQLTVPNAMITGISPRWRENAQNLPLHTAAGHACQHDGAGPASAVEAHG